MSVSGVGSNSTVTNTTATSSAAGSADEAQTRFMKMLIAQLKNQDPLNPMDNAAMTSQLAQLNMVSGINQLNTTLSTLAGHQSNAEAITAAGLLGRSVLVSGNTIQLSNGEAKFGLELKQAAESVKLSIKDSSGNVVHSMELGSQQAGLQTLSWDGQTDAGTTAAPGKYSFSVEALNAGEAVTASTLAYGTVNNVSMSGGLLKVNVENSGDINISDIRQIL